MSDSVAAVLFDLDGTLCEYRRNADELLDLAFADVGVDPFFGQREYLARFSEHAHVGDDIREIREACFAAIAEDSGYDPETGYALADAFADERDHSAVDFLPGAKDALDALAAEYPLGLVTNGDPWMQTQKLEGLEIAEDFETVIHAGYDAAAKPDPEPFHLALENLGVNGGGGVHVGNSLVSDVPGAKAAGLEAVWLDDGSDHRGEPDYVLDTLHDLLEPPW